MFYGRKDELELLEKLYRSKNFEFLVLYGRRRVGKTSLLQEFASKHKCIFFTGKEKNAALNLQGLSNTISDFYDEEILRGVADYQALLSYIGDHSSKEKTVFILDEFPYIAEEYPTIKSIFQNIIDQSWNKKNILLILCGSSISFMENETLGYKSPLYGRITYQLFLQPFNYYESAAFFPKYSAVDKIICYGILGGTPRYLNMFDDRKSVKTNLADHILGSGTFLKEEPLNLLKMELREPVIYNSILEAIATGASKLNEISGKIHEDSAKCSKYIDTLKKLHIVEKIVPCGEDEKSRKSIYRIRDNYFLFWYHYLFSNSDYYDMLGEKKAAAEIMADISSYMGNIFEDICRQYLIRKAKEGSLPFVPHKIGRWWGNNPAEKRQDDIDILCLDKTSKSAIFCECKFRNELFDLAEYKDFRKATEIIKAPKDRYYYIFVKSGYTKAVITQAKKDKVKLITVEDLFL